MPSTITETSLADLPVRRGKVRDIYDLGDTLLLVSTDRISAFDWVLPTGIPDKGRVLTQLSRFWFEHFKDVPNHMISCDVDDFDLPAGVDREPLVGRSMLVRKTSVVPIECVVRGYLSGSGWSEYQKTGAVCGIELPTGLKESDKLPGPIFTPATKAEQGDARREHHATTKCVARVGRELAKQLSQRSIDLYTRGAEYAIGRGHHHRRHEVRVRPGRRRADSDRRSADARQLAVLAGRRVQAGRRAAVVRQAVRARLAHARAAGTRTARRRSCRPKSWRRRGTSTSRRSSG